MMKPSFYHSFPQESFNENDNENESSEAEEQASEAYDDEEQASEAYSVMEQASEAYNVEKQASEGDGENSRIENEDHQFLNTIENEEDKEKKSLEESNVLNVSEVENLNVTPAEERIYHYLKDSKRRDRIFGPTQDKDNSWYLAKTPIYFENKHITVDNTKYPLTRGLIELLFLKDPISYNENDLNVYRKIVNKTSVHKCGHDPSGKIKSSKSNKYKNIISPLFVKRSSTKSHRKSMSMDKTGNTSQYTGEGFMDLNLEKPNFIYWDDPNELVSRLRLLISSTMAGHSGHNNEISSIIEELREANIIY